MIGKIARDPRFHRSVLGAAALTSLALAYGCSSAPTGSGQESAPTQGPSSESLASRFAGGRQSLSGHITAEMAAAPVVGKLPSDTPLTVLVGLPLRNRQKLGEALAAVSDPKSPSYRHFLTPEQFADAYGATVDDYEAVVAWAESHQLEVTRHDGRLDLEVRGPVSRIEDALHVRMVLAQRPDGTTFRMPDAEPSLDLDVPVERIGDLDDFERPVAANGGSGPNGSRQGTDFRHAYAGCTSLTGTGQTVGIFMSDAFYPPDVNTYFSSMGLPPPLAVQAVPAGSGVLTQPIPKGISQEGSIDVQMALSMAPGAQVVVFTGGHDAILSNMAARKDIKQLSSSWSITTDSMAQSSIAEIAMQGQSFVWASGDSGGFVNYNFGAGDPRLLPSITDVGGTGLNMLNNGGTYGTEVAWSGSAGGVLNTVAFPSYQSGFTTNGASSSNRNMPDVAAEGTDANIIFNGLSSQVNGTSVAAPLWAGFIALVNEQIAHDGQVPGLGSLNPALYQAAKAAYATNFNDIQQGSNGTFDAGAGYDLVTGLGSPKCALITTLSAALPTCQSGVSCSGISGYAPPELTVGCGPIVDFYRKDPGGGLTSLGTGTSVTDQESAYTDELLACSQGTMNCAAFSEYAPGDTWCNQGMSGGSSGSVGGGSSGGKGCFGHICQ